MATSRDMIGRLMRAARAATSVAALYALVLQAVLGGAAVAGGAPLGVLCLSHGEGSTGEPASPDAHHHGACCTLAHTASPAAPPSSETEVAWPVRQAAPVAWRAHAAHAPRAPPCARPRVRAPPSPEAID